MALATSCCHPGKFRSPSSFMAPPCAGSWIEFPKLSIAKNKLMTSLATRLDRELGSLLNSTLTPPEVRSFQSQDGVSQGSVVLRSGKQGSKIRFLLGSWLHSSLPFGPLNITTLQTILEPEIDSPHLLVELIQTGYKSLVLCVDNMPRKDLVMDPEYLKRFYEDSKLDELRAKLVKLPQCEYYVSPSLFVRVMASPTALLLKFAAEGEEELDGVVEESITPCVEEAVSIWLHGFTELGRTLTSEAQISSLRERDDMMRKNSVEVDLGANMPRLFGQETTDRVIAAVIKGE
ncbi:red chlorophyll catabolite reductase, chloroplastic [Selaginella moellendorffii]|nr:red chlorophyll catabolite reductase, chloroplastic [Selaginella moellendorffii]|eukprot:XP_002989763.2 red chlorophyll catabolite reductase, chloroplastic [Selaginella moellendorffii]